MYVGTYVRTGGGRTVVRMGKYYANWCCSIAGKYTHLAASYTVFILEEVSKRMLKLGRKTKMYEQMGFTLTFNLPNVVS